MMSPGSPAPFSTLNLSSATTRYCLPPVLMTANIFPSCSTPALGFPARLLVQSIFGWFSPQSGGENANARGPGPAPRDAYGGAGQNCQENRPPEKCDLISTGW